MVIYKESLPCPGIKVVALPYSSITEAKKHIMKVDSLRGEPVMWYAALEQPRRKFVVISIATEHDVSTLVLSEYIGSAIVVGDSNVLHYFLTDFESLEARGVPLDKC